MIGVRIGENKVLLSNHGHGLSVGRQSIYGAKLFDKLPVSGKQV